MWKEIPGSGSTCTTCEVYFYGVTGQKLETYSCSYTGVGFVMSLEGINVYFGKKLLQSKGAWVATDKLGSVRYSSSLGSMSYYPYGGERETPNTANGVEKFGTYTRDAVGQDYAEQRYYNSGVGAFWSPDPSGIKTANPRNPLSWNRYAYAKGNPIGRFDRHGLKECGDDDEEECDESYCDLNPEDPICNALPTGGGDNPTPQKPTVSDAAMGKKLQKALALAEKLLGETSCAGLFNSPNSQAGPSPAPLIVLAQISGDFIFGNIPPTAPNTVTSATTAGIGNTQIAIGDGAFLNVHTSVEITLNDTSQGASFVSGSTYDQAITILHELGHAYWDLYGPGTSQIVPDGESVATSQSNTNLIKANCK